MTIRNHNAMSDSLYPHPALSLGGRGVLSQTLRWIDGRSELAVADLGDDTLAGLHIGNRTNDLTLIFKPRDRVATLQNALMAHRLQQPGDGFELDREINKPPVFRANEPHGILP